MDNIESRLMKVELTLANQSTHLVKIEGLMAELVKLQSEQLNLQNKIDRAGECCKEFHTCQVEGCKALSLANTETRMRNAASDHKKENMSREIDAVKAKAIQLDDRLAKWDEIFPVVKKMVDIVDSTVTKLLGGAILVAVLAGMGVNGYGFLTGG